MSTEEQRAIWRQKAREQRQRKLAAASGANPAPSRSTRLPTARLSF